MIANPNDGNSPRVEVATPMIDVSAGGLITAKTEQEKGYVPGGTKSATQQLTTQGAATITPGTTEQVAVASGRYTTGDVQVAGDANLVPENIAEGVSIFGVDGTHSGGAVDTVILTIEGNPNQTTITYYLHGEILTKGNLGYPATLEVDKGSLACTYGYPGFTPTSVSGDVVLINSVLVGNPMEGFTNSSNLIQINGDGTIRC